MADSAYEFILSRCHRFERRSIQSYGNRIKRLRKEYWNEVNKDDGNYYLPLLARTEELGDSRNPIDGYFM